MMSDNVTISVSEVIGKERIADFLDELSSLDVEVIERPNHPIAGLEWLLPAGIVVYLTKTYLDTWLKEVAKDHYQIFKKAISEKIQPRFIGPDGEKLRSFSTKGKIKNEGVFSSTFSISVLLKNGDQTIELKLLIPENADQETVDAVFAAFYRFATSREEKALVEMLSRMDQGRRWPKAVWLNPKSMNIELIDVVQSGRQGKVISTSLEE